MSPPPLQERVRRICLALPEAEERTSHGSPAFFVKRQFAHLWPVGHHDRPFPQLWCAAGPGMADELLRLGERYFRPPYVGTRGWVGLRLDGRVAWGEVEDLCVDAYRAVAPARLLRRLDPPPP